MQFLDQSVLEQRRAVTDLWHMRFRHWIRAGWFTAAEAKQGILDLRRAGTIDDVEAEGLIERLGLGAS